MAEKEIALLKEQLARLDEKNFDFDAWKNHTLIFLERIFGKENSKLNLIKELHYDYSSWNLRDTAATGKSKDKDPVKMQASEILQATITELEKLGLPKNKLEGEKVWELLQDELTGKQAKEIEAILNSDDSNKTENIGKILEVLGQENLATVITKLLIH
ncbi:MAG: hypothetical protein HQ522_11265 [Bacteroidetes bacterium]|nr:hypothetical protein [Bacteroidota bacterium]